MVYAKHMVSTQREPARKDQVQNNAGGYVWQVSKWDVLQRFLILGAEGGTYYVKERNLTRENASTIAECIEEDGKRVVNETVDVSVAGRAPRNTPALFVLALCASFGGEEVRKYALSRLSEVARTGTHLFIFAEYVNTLRGWGRGLRSAIASWYQDTPIHDLAYQAVKYKQREGWSHRDLLRLSHPKTSDPNYSYLYRYMLDGTINRSIVGVDEQLANYLETIESLKTQQDVGRICDAIVNLNLPREVVPTEHLNNPRIWEALLIRMPMTAMVRNLGNMSKVGLLTTGSAAAASIAKKLENEQHLLGSRIHPMQVLVGMRTYQGGHGFRGSGTWEPVTKVVDALNNAFYVSFKNVKPTGKRLMLALDVSGSMSWSPAGMTITSAEAVAAMAMITARVESDYVIMAFADVIRPLDISPTMRLDTVLRKTQDVNFGGTDCALPMRYAAAKKIPVDAFVVYTDNETWAGPIHPFVSLRDYRSKMGINSKSIVVATTATHFSIADPNDKGMLDVVGFDTSVPQVMSQFISGE